MIALLVSASLVAQDKDLQQKKKPPAKKQAVAKKVPHQKPTPEQIRKFNELQKKQ